MTRGRERRGRATLAMTLLALLAGCHAAPTYVVERVIVAPTPAMRSLDAAGIPDETLGAAATRSLERTKGFVAAARARSDTPRFLGQVEVERAEVRAGGPGAGATAHVSVSMTLEARGGGATLRESGRGSAPVVSGADGLRTALERAAVAAVESAVASFSVQAAAERKSSAELVRDLSSSDAGAREHALRVLGGRREADALPALVARLRDPDTSVRERAVGALAQLRDPRAVPALIDLVHRRDPAYVAQMARIIGDIGGPDATAWLLTMAWGHPEQVVRSAAHDALAELNARELHAHAQR